MRRAVAARVVVALAFVVTSLGFAVQPPADANDPEVCGYVRYSTSTGPTTTVPYVPFCERPCGGAGVHLPPNSVAGNEVEALVCVRPP